MCRPNWSSRPSACAMKWQSPSAAPCTGAGSSFLSWPATWVNNMPELDRDNEQFNQGVTHTVELLAKLLEVDDWVAGDGSEDYDDDLSQTMLNILTAKGLYDADEGKFLAPEGWLPIETVPKDGTEIDILC